LHEAWDLEWAGNLERLAGVFGHLVAAWELLPDPGDPAARVAPRRWVHHLLAGAAAVRRGAPEAVVLPGALPADAQDEPRGFLAAALDPAAADAWRSAGLGGLTLAFCVLPQAGADEEQVIATVRQAAEGAAATAVSLGVGGAPGLTIVSWSATECGEDDQGRNLWAAFNTLSSHGHGGPVIWRSLLDSGDGRGLFRGPAADDDQRRPAWSAFNDFALYAAQIAPALAAIDSTLPAAPDVRPETTGEVIRHEPTGEVVPVEPTDEVIRHQPTGEVVPAEPTGEVIRLRVPSAEELLRAQGLGGRRLEAALETLAARHPFALQPGEYDLPLPADLDLGPTYTNQDVISAFYRVGRGTWDVLERAGIELRDLTADRNAPYRGVSLEELSALTDDERVAVLGELERLKSEPAIR
jgi:hypothetical protein